MQDLEMCARHAKRTTINTEDVKLLARRSNSLLKHITDKSEELAQINLERKAQKTKKRMQTKMQGSQQRLECPRRPEKGGARGVRRGPVGGWRAATDRATSSNRSGGTGIGAPPQRLGETLSEEEEGRLVSGCLAPSENAAFSNLRATGGAGGPRESPAPPYWERQLPSPITERGRELHGYPDAGDQWDLGSWVDREEWAWSESESKVSSAITARAAWRAKLERRGGAYPCVETLANAFSFGPRLQIGSSLITESATKRSSKARRENHFNLGHLFAPGNGEWAIRPDFYPVQPAFISILPHCYSGFGLCWKDNCLIQAAVQ
ncbi:hypothetical protein H8959_007698 [Pygathrix nigripes]